MSYSYDYLDDYDENVWEEFQSYVNQLKNHDVYDVDFENRYALEEEYALRREIRREKRENNEIKHKSIIDEFVGIIDGINYDGIINSAEVESLRQWLDRNFIILKNTRYGTFLHLIKEIISDGVVDDQERTLLLKHAAKFKSDIVSVDESLHNLSGILKGIISDSVIVNSEVESLYKWIEDNSHLSGVLIYDKLRDVLNNILEDGVITPSEMEYLQTYISCELISDASVNKGSNNNEQKSEEYLFSRIKDILKANDGLKAKEIASYIEGTKIVEINSLLYSKKYRDAFIQDDDFKWHLRDVFGKLADEEKEILKSILTDDIHDLNLVKQQFFKHTDNDNTDKINQLNMLDLGYQIAGPILYKSKVQTVNDFLKWVLQKDLIVDLSNVDCISQLAVANKTINELKMDFTIVEFDKLKFINIRKLEEGGVTKDLLIDYCNKACAFANKQYFNIKSIYDEGFSHPLDNLGFGTFFYESIIKASDRCSTFRINDTFVFLEGQYARGLPEIIERFVNAHGSIDIYDLIDYLSRKFGIDIGKKKVENELRKTELFYSETMEKAYRDYEEFFMEV